MSGGLADSSAAIRAAAKTPLADAPGAKGAPLSEAAACGRLFSLRSAEFRKGREQSWERLDDILASLDKWGIKSLSYDEVEKLPLLHRSLMSSLSVARNIVLDRNLLLYLEDLAMRSYLAVYGPRVGLLKSLKSFFQSGFPREVRAIRWHMAAALLALMAGAAAGYFLVAADMNYFHTIVPESLAGGRGPGSTAEELLRTEIFAPCGGFVESFVLFASFLFRHNTIIGILAFGLSFALGLPTVFLLIHNGLILGAFIALHADKGLAVDFIGWLSIHGMTEFLAITLCGGAGLAVAEKIIFPGALPRLDSLTLYGRKAASVAAGAVFLFFIAGILEGGFRQLISDTPGRYAFAGATGGLWLLYFSRAGRGGRYAPED